MNCPSKGIQIFTPINRKVSSILGQHFCQVDVSCHFCGFQFVSNTVSPHFIPPYVLFLIYGLEKLDNQVC